MSSNFYNNTHVENSHITGIKKYYFVAGYKRGVEDTCTLLAEDSRERHQATSYLAIALTSKNKVDKIMENYELVRKDEVQDFFQENTMILGLVNDSYGKIHELIPETKKVSLEVLVDPEDNQKNLIAKISIDLPIDEAIDKLDEFDKQWFASRFIDSDMNFNVSLDFE